MKSTWRVATWLLVLLLVALSVEFAAAQSQNSTATNWLRVGLRETDPQRKIAAYRKALELDPNFIEALYNLGMAYMEGRDYRSAEQLLLRANNAKPDKARRTQILYELARTQRALGKAKEAEATLREVKGLLGSSDQQAGVSLELGRLMYEQGRYNDALKELRAGKALAAKDQNQFDALIQAIEANAELLRLYEVAERARTGGNLKEAKSLYEQIAAKQPSFRDADAKLVALNAQIERETKRTSLTTNLTALYDQAKKHEADGQLDLAISAYENLLHQDGNYKDATTRLESVRQQLAQKELDEKLESEYAGGMAALRVRNWTRAILAFEKVLEMDRNHRDARRRLTEAQNGQERENTDTIVARYYADGVAAMNRNDLGSALAALEKVRRYNSNYRNTTSLLAQIESALNTTPPVVTAPSTPPAAQPNLDSLYQEALAAIDKQDWTRAVVALEELHILQPNYRDVVHRLAEARTNMNRIENSAAVAETERRPPRSFFPTTGVLVVLIIVPILGFLVLSPTIRAKYYIWRNDPNAAALVYETALARRPNRVTVYPPLANIYLRQGRKDERAMKVYRTVLQLNIPVRNREEINSIVATNYLTEGRTDSDAIEVLEKQLAVELNRRKFS